MKKLIIAITALTLAGCAYKVVFTCDEHECFHQAVMPWQEAPEPFLGDDSLTISDEQCQAMLNLVAAHYGSDPVEDNATCNPDD